MSFRKTIQKLVLPLGVGCLFANYYYHHKNYIESLFKPDWKPPVDHAYQEFLAQKKELEEIKKEALQIQSEYSSEEHKPCGEGLTFQGKEQRKLGGKPGKGILHAHKENLKLIGVFTGSPKYEPGHEEETKMNKIFKGIILRDDKIVFVGYKKDEHYMAPGMFLHYGVFTCITKEVDPDNMYARCFDDKGTLRYLGHWKGTRMYGEGKLYDEYHDLIYHGTFDKNGVRSDLQNR